MTVPFSAPDSARRIGMCCWFEQQVFALLGRWVIDTPEPEPKLVMLELSDHAAWRAQRWYELLPTAAPGADALVLGGEELDELILSAHGASGERRTVAKLIVAEALIGTLDAIVADLADRSSAISGAAVLRIARIARADIATDLERCRRIMVSAGMAGTGAEADTGAGHGLEAFRNRLDSVPSFAFLARS
jgi:hypothetical protein